MRGYFCGLLFAFCAAASAAPKAELWSFWQVSNETSTKRIDHSIWQSLLDVYLDAEHPSGVSRFDYASVSDKDKHSLDRYLLELQALDPRVFRLAEQKAYWLNLYNALTVQRVLKAYPVDSILKADGGIFRRGPWNKKYLTIAGQPLSLNDIEHRILRPIWQDSRIHFAVNCASIGCPNLQPEAYLASELERQLEQAAVDYLTHSRGIGWVGDDILKLSKIFDWYSDDFGGDESAVLRSLSSYLPTTQAAKLVGYKGRIEYHYDWSINQP